MSGKLTAGAGKSVITPPKELWSVMRLYDGKEPIAGVADELHARALTLGAVGKSEAISVVAVEMLIIPPTLYPAVKTELAKRGLGDVRLTLSATHTHTGPGNFWKVPFGRFYMGSYCDEYFQFLVTRLADAVEASVKSMRPARIGFAKVQTAHLVRSRRWVDPQTKLAPPVDEELGVMRVDAKDGSGTIAYALNFAAHPTSLMHKTDGRLSADYPGAAANRLEKLHPGAIALFLQGGVGSVLASAPKRFDNEHKFDKVALEGDLLAYGVAKGEKAMTFDDRLDLVWESLTVKLPGADAHLFPEERPYLALRVLTIIPNWLVNRLADWLFVSDRAIFQAMRVNHTYFFTFPADFSNTLGRELKDHVRRDHVFVLALANDYALGYVLSRQEYDMGGMHGHGLAERVQNYFGKRTGPFCIKIAHMLANRVKEPKSADPFFYGADEIPGGN